MPHAEGCCAPRLDQAGFRIAILGMILHLDAIESKDSAAVGEVVVLGRGAERIRSGVVD